MKCEICAVFQNDSTNRETMSHFTRENAQETEASCEAEGQASVSAESQSDATQESYVTLQTSARQTKPKKLSKKQLLAEQRRKDRVCEEFFVQSCVPDSHKIRQAVWLAI